MQASREYSTIRDNGEPEQLRSRAKGLRDRNAANRLKQQAQDLELQKSVFMQKFSAALSVRPFDCLLIMLFSVLLRPEQAQNLEL